MEMESTGSPALGFAFFLSRQHEELNRGLLPLKLMLTTLKMKIYGIAIVSGAVSPLTHTYQSDHDRRALPVAHAHPCPLQNSPIYVSTFDVEDDEGLRLQALMHSSLDVLEERGALF
jgi:hypothetical protein